MDKLAEIRPKLKRHTIFLQTSMGVFFPGIETPFLLKGRSISHWMSRISPYLNGQYTVEELCQNLAPEQRETFTRLISQLMDKGLVKNDLPEAPNLLAPAAKKRFRAQIEYIDHYANQPIKRFKTFRESRLLLIGSGESYLALARSLMRNGLQHLFLAPTEEPGRYLDVLEAESTSYRQNGLELTIELVGQQYEEALNGTHEYDSIVYCADQSCLQTLQALHQWCFSHEQTFLSALFFSGRALLGPLVQPHQGPCWLCAQMRLAAHEPEAQQAAFWRNLALDSPLPPHEPDLLSPVARRVGNSLAFELFKAQTGALPPETEQGVIIQNLETLEATHCKLLPHPLCPLCSRSDEQTEIQKLEEIVTGEHDCLLSQEELLKEATSRLINERTGPFQKFADETFLQLPLKVTRLIASPPVSPLADCLEVTAYSLENIKHARLAALTSMAAAYAQALPDTRRTLVSSMQELRDAGHKVIPPSMLSTVSGLRSLTPQTRIHWYPALSLAGQQICYVPAGAVFPHSGFNSQRLFERTLVGAATGATFQEILQSALSSTLAYELLHHLLQGQNELIRIDQSSLVDLDTDLAFLLRCVQHSERDISLFEVFHEAPLHLFIAHTRTEAGDRTAIGTGLSGPVALTEALRNLLGDLQILQSEGTFPASRSLIDISPRAEFLFADPAASRFSASAVSFEDLEAYVRAGQREIVFANTTPSDIWATRTWTSGMVLLASSAQETDNSVTHSLFC